MIVKLININSTVQNHQSTMKSSDMKTVAHIALN